MPKLNNTRANSNASSRNESKTLSTLILARQRKLKRTLAKIGTYEGKQEERDLLRTCVRQFLAIVEFDKQLLFPALVAAPGHAAVTSDAGPSALQSVSSADESEIRKMQIGRDLALLLLNNLIRMRPEEPFFTGLANALLERVAATANTHQIYTRFRKRLRNEAHLAERLAAQPDPDHEVAEDSFSVPMPQFLRSGAPQAVMEKDMPQRDERGRFMDDDDDRRHSSGGGRGNYSRSRRDDEEGPGWRGDSRGHSEASQRGWETRRSRYDDDHHRRQPSRGDDRDYDDDRGYGGSNTRVRSSSHRDDDEGRGWYGDSRGHSEASRRGWESRRSSDDEAYDRRSPSPRSSYDEDHRDMRRSSGDQDHRYRNSSSNGDRRRTGGWFGDWEGHSEASRRGWDKPDHGDSGWHGDPEGHAAASRRGWEHRSDRDYDRRRGR